MKSTWQKLSLIVVLAFWTHAAFSQLELIPNQPPQAVFAGSHRTISLVLRNNGNERFESEIHARVLQATSGTVVNLGDVPWKKLQVLPQQTVCESANIDFPPVKAKTKFLIQWLDDTNSIFGVTEVQIYPTNLLVEMKALIEGELGLFDPQNRIKSSLKNAEVKFVDLNSSEIQDMSGKLLIIGPVQSETQMQDALKNGLHKLIKTNVAIVWILPEHENNKKLQPSYCLVPNGRTGIVFVQPDLVSNLSEKPQSQLNLIQFCELALNPRLPACCDWIK